MGMPAIKTHWTVEMVEDLPDDGQRYEVVDGDLVVVPAPSMDHQVAVAYLYERVAPYARAHGFGHVIFGPGAVYLSEDTYVEPDLFVTPLLNGKRTADWHEAKRPPLAVEIISPSTSRHDRVRKRELYQRYGIPEYWIVDLDSQLVERWRPDDKRAEILITELSWQPQPEIAPLVVDLEGYFAQVLDR